MDIRLCTFLILIMLIILDLFKPQDIRNLKTFKRWLYFGLVFVLCLVLMGIFEWTTGVLTSKYHFIDDHDMIDAVNSVKQYGLLKGIIYETASDFSIRFRPVYKILRTIQSAALWNHFFLLHVSHMMVIVSGMSLAYYLVRRLGYRRWIAFVFTAITYLGVQSPLIWRLGPQKGEALLFLFLTLVLIDIYSEKGSKAVLVLIIISTVILSGCKESFTVIIPILPVILAYLCSENKDFKSVIGCVFKKNIVYTAITWAIFLGECIFIVFFVGTNSIGYAGVDSSYTVLDYILAILKTCSLEKQIRWYVLVMLVTIVFAAISLIKEKNKVEGLWFYIVSFTYLIGVEFILQAKSGFRERYVVTIACLTAYLLCVIAPKIIKSVRIGLPITEMMIMTILMFAMTYTDITAAAQEYAQDGVATTAVLDDMGEHIPMDATIINNLSDENALSIKTYLGNYYGYSGTSEYSQELDNVSDYDVIFGDFDHTSRQLDELGVNLDDYEYHWGQGYAYWIKIN